VRFAFAVLALGVWAGAAQADATRAVCFIGPVLLDGVADGACVRDERERKRLLDLPVADWKRKPAPLTMGADEKSKKTIAVATCRKWLQAVSRNRVAVGALSRSREPIYQRTCLTLDQLKFAAPSRRAHLLANGRDLLRPGRVPARLLERAGIKGPLPLPGATVADLSKSGELILREATIGMMEVTWRSADLVLNPVARGDFDRDGIEDLAIAMEVVLRGSKRRQTKIVLLTRQTAKGPLEMIYPKARR
jgi:hypothetical protein